MPKLFLLVYVILLVISGITLRSFIAENIASFIPVFLAMLLFLLRLIYDSFEIVYLNFNKFLATIFNQVNNWELEVQYYLDEYDAEILDSVVDTFKKHFNKTDIWQSTEQQRIIKTPRFVSRVRLVPAVEDSDLSYLSNSLHLEITDMTVPFRSTERILKKELTPLIEALTTKLNGNGAKYVFRIRYEDKNPFFGMYIRKLPPNSVHRFHCELFELIGGENESVEIHKEHTVIITSNVNSMQTLSEKYLLLSSSFA